MNRLKEHIFMIGFMGVGKTSTSRILSKKLGVKENDTDAMIVKQEKKSIAEIFADEGEEYFRKTETGIIDKLAELEPCIVSCGGGMAMREVNVEKMKKIGKVVLLTATPETIYSHVKDSTNRPLLNGNMNILLYSDNIQLIALFHAHIRHLEEKKSPMYEAEIEDTLQIFNVPIKEYA